MIHDLDKEPRMLRGERDKRRDDRPLSGALASLPVLTPAVDTTPAAVCVDTTIADCGGVV